MASEWVGVVGTAVGVGIGRAVTVASLFLKGRQDAAARTEAAERDDRLRSDDRAWEVRRQNVEQRRELYGELLDAVAEVVRLGVISARP